MPRARQTRIVRAVSPRARPPSRRLSIATPAWPHGRRIPALAAVQASAGQLAQVFTPAGAQQLAQAVHCSPASQPPFFPAASGYGQIIAAALTLLVTLAGGKLPAPSTALADAARHAEQARAILAGSAPDKRPLPLCGVRLHAGRIHGARRCR